jgi:membrane-associated phospholipid phosphatase
MKLRSTILFFSLLIYCGTAQAQWLPKDSTYEYCAVCHGGQHLIGQPYNHQLKLELPLLLSSAAILTTGFIMQSSDKTKPYTEEQLVGLDKNSINSFDRVATGYWKPGIASASDYMLIGISFLPVLFLSEHHTGHDFKSLLIMTAETFALNYGTTYIVKSTVNRTRPYVYNTELPVSTRTDKESRQSYYSGHTSQTAAATFLFAKVISDFHPYLKPGVKTGIWAFAITVPAVEAYLRVKGGKHYPTDVITGYALGALSGWLIPQLHRNKNYTHGKKKDIFNMGIAPSINGGMVMNMRLQF